MQHHLLIAGAGRSGTSFLVKVLHHAGLETHLSLPNGGADWSDDANAGLEDMLSDANLSAPYVVKSPWLFENIDRVLQGPHVIDGVIIPVRELGAAAGSRAILEFQSRHRANHWLADQPTWETAGSAVGGAVFSTHPIDQARILASGFYKLVQRLTDADIPTYFLSFPRFATDGDYLYERLRACLPPHVTKGRLMDALAQVADPSKIRVADNPALDASTAENVALKRELALLRRQMAERQQPSEVTIERLREEHDRQLGELRAALALRVQIRDRVARLFRR